MLDGVVRGLIQPTLDRMGGRLHAVGVGANALTLAAFATGVCSAIAIALGAFGLAAAMLLLSRLIDGLDGAVARVAGITDFGGFLDILLDFAVYGAVPFGFVLLDPEANAVAGAALLLAFYINGSSFLAFAAIAGRRGMRTDVRGTKSLYFTTGLTEGTETIAVLVGMCVFPSAFVWLAWFFAAACAYTTLSRVVQAREALGD